MGRKKIDKEFLLTDNSINCYGFRLLTSGLKMDEVKKNPIGFHMHKRDEGVVLSWVDHRISEDKLYAKPVINLQHPRAEQTISEIENGFLNGASVGMIVALKVSDNPEDYLPNQEGPTISEWFYRECSLVDISGNFNAVALNQIGLFDANEQALNLSDFTNPKIPNMEKITLTADQLSKLNLSADASPAEVNTAFSDLVARAGRATAAEQKLADLQAETVGKEVKHLIASALSDTKITKDLAAKLEKDYSDNPTGLKDLLGAMPKYQSIQSQIEGDASVKKLNDLMAKSYDELFQSGELADLKALSIDDFNKKKAEKFPQK